MANVNYGDAARDSLRTVVTAIDREISQLTPTSDGQHPPGELRASWNKLVQLLALGPAPETRECPVCGSTGMRAASRCMHCWSKLEPLAVTATATEATEAPRSNA